jgi:hypothetical protein
MLRVTSRLTRFAVAILAVASAGDLIGQEAKTSRPATVADAARVIDLETFPLMTGGASSGPRRLASLRYAAKGDTRGAYAFQKKTLEARGWKELPGGYLSDTSCSGAFGKDGFTVSVSTSPAYGPDAAGLVQLQLTNHGNVDVSKLPVPSDAKLLYSFPTITAYVTEKSVKDTSESLRKLLTAQGWEPYGTAGDSMFFKKNAVRISAWPSVAPAQGNKTVIQLGSELLSADLPAPPALLDASYADTTKALSIDVDMTPEGLAAFYRDALGKAGWKPTTEKPVKIDFREMMIFRNDAKDITTLMMHTIDGKLRANLEHQTAAEFAEAMRRAAVEEAKRKAESARLAKMASEAAAKNLVTVAIVVPAGAKGVERAKDRLEFKVAAGKAKAVVQTIRADLLKKGWKANTASLDSLAGTVVLTKKVGVSLTIVYVDTGLQDAEVTISTFGAEIEVPKAK